MEGGLQSGFGTNCTGAPTYTPTPISKQPVAYERVSMDWPHGWLTNGCEGNILNFPHHLWRLTFLLVTKPRGRLQMGVADKWMSSGQPQMVAYTLWTA